MAGVGGAEQAGRGGRGAKPAAPKSGIHVRCQWSLYPLGDPGYMDIIYRAIDMTKAAGVHRAGKHFVSHLGGDLVDVLGAIREAFDASCGHAGHVTAHLTLSANSPTTRGEQT